MGEKERKKGKHNIDLAGQQIRYRRSGPTIGNVQHVDVSGKVQHFPGQMRQAAGAGGDIGRAFAHAERLVELLACRLAPLGEQ